MSLIARQHKPAQPVGAIEVAREFFALAKAENSPEFTTYKLQKLLYHAQSKSQTDRGRPLFSEQVRAWEHGPVVACVYYVTKGLRIISYRNENLDKPSDLGSSDRLLIHAVWERFKHLSGDQLSNLSHEDPGYKAARQRKDMFHRNPVIRPEDMRSDVTERRSDECEIFSAFVSGLEAGS